MERHLPARFQPGVQLGAEDISEIKRLLTRRDQHLQRLYREVRELQATLNVSRHSDGRGAAANIRLEDVPADMPSAGRIIRGLRHRVDEMEASTSWRITAPVRALKRLLSGKG